MTDNTDITTMDIKTLKAICFDQMVILQQTQQNINLIQQQIALRKADAAKPVEVLPPPASV